MILKNTVSMFMARLVLGCANLRLRNPVIIIRHAARVSTVSTCAARFSEPEWLQSFCRTSIVDLREESACCTDSRWLLGVPQWRS